MEEEEEEEEEDATLAAAHAQSRETSPPTQKSQKEIRQFLRQNKTDIFGQIKLWEKGNMVSNDKLYIQ